MTFLNHVDKRWGQGMEWKWARETEGDTEKERDGPRCTPHGAPTHCCRISAFAAMNHCLTYIWAPQLEENLTDIITWQFPPTCSKLQSCNSLLSGSLLPYWSGLSTWCDNIIHWDSRQPESKTPSITEFQSIPRVNASFLLLGKTSAAWFISNFVSWNWGEK